MIGRPVTSTTAEWNRRADIAQASLDHFYGTASPQLLNNRYPILQDSDNETFNYWWLAHAIDARLDGFERSGDQRYLDQAVELFENILERNEGSLFNDYFDDMLWYALATLRMAQHTQSERFQDAAVAIWEHCVEFGWNDTFGESLSWRKQQLYYKNTPANGPFAILSARLFALRGDERFASYGATAHEWIRTTLRDAESGFVEDGINREEDGRVDTQWRFTYNQGLFIGSAVEQFRATGDRIHLAEAVQTAHATLTHLGSAGVLIDDGDGGDEGLFKGVFFRYLTQLLSELGEDEAAPLKEYVLSACETLWASSFDGEYLLAANDWSQRPDGQIFYSTQLSAIMGLELAALISRS